MTTFSVPTRDQVSAGNQQLFDALHGKLNFVPNLYAAIAYSDHALGTYLALQSAKTSLTNREKEIVNLVVSQINECRYCLSAHTFFGKMNGFSDDEILELRKGTASFNAKYDALAKLTKEIASSKGHPSAAALDAFFAAGYTQGSLVDTLVMIADKTIANYLHNITQVPIDFPVAVAL